VLLEITIVHIDAKMSQVLNRHGPHGRKLHVQLSGMVVSRGNVLDASKTEFLYDIDTSVKLTRVLAKLIVSVLYSGA
jgi:hypothetical protein